MNKIIPAAALAAVLLSACASAPSDEQGYRWPQWDKTTAVSRGGTYPLPEAVAQIRPGMDKNQLFALMGRPHYPLGWHSPRWDYLLHFHNPENATETVCQMQAVFDKSGQNGKVVELNWRLVSPADGVCPPVKGAWVSYYDKHPANAPKQSVGKVQAATPEEASVAVSEPVQAAIPEEAPVAVSEPVQAATPEEASVAVSEPAQAAIPEEAQVAVPQNTGTWEPLNLDDLIQSAP